LRKPIDGTARLALISDQLTVNFMADHIKISAKQYRALLELDKPSAPAVAVEPVKPAAIIDEAQTATIANALRIAIAVYAKIWRDFRRDGLSEMAFNLASETERIKRLLTSFTNAQLTAPAIEPISEAEETNGSENNVSRCACITCGVTFGKRGVSGRGKFDE